MQTSRTIFGIMVQSIILLQQEPPPGGGQNLFQRASEYLSQNFGLWVGGIVGVAAFLIGGGIIIGAWFSNPRATSYSGRVLWGTLLGILAVTFAGPVMNAIINEAKK